MQNFDSLFVEVEHIEESDYDSDKLDLNRSLSEISEEDEH